MALHRGLSALLGMVLALALCQCAAASDQPVVVQPVECEASEVRFPDTDCYRVEPPTSASPEFVDELFRTLGVTIGREQYKRSRYCAYVYSGANRAHPVVSVCREVYFSGGAFDGAERMAFLKPTWEWGDDEDALPVLREWRVVVEPVDCTDEGFAEACDPPKGHD